MGWKSVCQDAGKEDQVSSSLADDGSITNTLTSTYIAVTDGTGGTDGTVTEAMSAVAPDGAVPVVGSYISNGGQLYKVNGSRPKRTGPHSFEVQLQAVAKFTPPSASTTSNVSITIGGVQSTQDAFYDRNDAAIVNSAGQTFDPSITETIYDESLTISYNTTTDQSSSFAAARGKLNQGSVTIALQGISRTFDDGCLLCVDAQTQDTLPLQDGTPTFKATLNFIGRTDGFALKVLDQGKYMLATDGSGKVTPILDAKQKPITEPVLLNGSGQPSTDGTPHYLSFDQHEQADFSSLFTGLS